MELSHFLRTHELAMKYISCFERVMHDVGNFVPFTESSSHNSDLIPIFFRSAHPCPWFLVFLFVLSNVPEEALTHILLNVHHINRMMDI
jgi:hypothetical protein